MALKCEWLTPPDLDRLADMRLRCYGDKPADRDAMRRRTAEDRFDPGDALILSDSTGDLATATAMSFLLNVRGKILPCQGVAWVGAVRSHRRRKIEGHGLASHVMHAMLAKARERGQAVSMLAPFRASFYEHFGYGVMERQNVWTLPLSVLPRDEATHFSEATEADFDAMLANRERQFRQTHGDVQTDARSLRYWLNNLGDSGFRMIEKVEAAVTSQFTLGSEIVGDTAVAVVHRPYWDSPAALRRLLAMLGTLRDQYTFARITLPADLPIGWWLSERQQPHRRVDHPAPRCAVTTRMQARILDSAKFLNAITLPSSTNGALSLRIIECDGPATTVMIEISEGKVDAKTTSGAADVTMSDVTWAAVGFGDQRASVLATMGLIEADNPEKLLLLDAFHGATAPYCHEYF